MQRDMFPPPHAHPQLQTFEAIESPHAFLVHGPAVTAQQDPDAQEPEAWPRVRELADTEAQRRLILRWTLSIPGRATERRESAGPHATDLEGGLKPASQLAAPCGRQTFFRSASDSMCLSRLRSATRRFSRVFSSSICRSRRSSLTPRCAYFFFHA